LYFGEAGYVPLAQQSPFFDIAQYALNGDALDRARVGCWASPIAGNAIAYHVCDSVRVTLGPGTLVDGVRDELTVGDAELGTFVAQGIDDRAPPSVVAAIASGYTLEVTFSKPMPLDQPCGGEWLRRILAQRHGTVRERTSVTTPRPTSASTRCCRRSTRHVRAPTARPSRSSPGGSAPPQGRTSSTSKVPRR
jgi:hypothetical protein